MKKFVSIALAIVMVLSLSVSVFAVDDDYINSIASEVLSEHTVLFPADNGWWDQSGSGFTSSDDEGIAFIEAVQTEGAKVIIKADAYVASDEEGAGYQYAIQTTDTWVFITIHSNYPDEGEVAAESVVVEGDYAYLIVDAAELVEACLANDIDLTSNTWQWIHGACSGAKTYGVYVVTLAETEETTEEAEATEETTEEATEEASESTETSSPDTGVALALVPMAIAGIAVVSSKRR
ncbi:MAG: hypothetical protein LIO49_05095 [Ruminococcus sp.]|nr:hypothetical protein [Ruminococcus sp.]